MRAGPQSRKTSTAEAEAHMIDLYTFRSWCRYCVMAAARSDHHRRQAEDYNGVTVTSCDEGFFTDRKDDDRQPHRCRRNSSWDYTHTRDSGQEKQNDSCRRCALQRN